MNRKSGIRSKSINSTTNMFRAKRCKGDVIEVKEKSRQLPLVLEAIDSPERDIPDYIEVDYEKMRGTFVRTPQLADVPYPVEMDPKLVVEFYSSH